MYRAALIAFALFAASAAFAAIEDPVRIDAGMISGAATATPDVRVYKGIPFAAPPVGDLRWRAPKPAAHWDGVRKADAFGAECMRGGGGRGTRNVSEDCLYLNVWTGAQKPGEKRPVMVWIYGGGYTSGSGSQSMYDGEALAKKGAIIVTFNYRLGALGFFSYPELTTESDRRGAGNFGVMDSIAALQWVQKNIAAFGGDPKRVTIFGESAGAGMVANLTAIPQAKGLFERASGDSSAWSTAQINKLQTLSEAEAAGVKAAERLGAKSLADLRAQPAAAILRGGGRGAAPIVDGWLIREDPSKVFAEGKEIEVPVLVGSNRDESFGGNPRSASDFIEQAHKRYGDLADEFLKVYPASSDEQAKESAFFSGRDEMAFVMRNWARLVSKSGKKSFVYYFTEQPPVVPGARGPFAPTVHGSATHVSEILYLFDHLDNGRPWTDQDRKVADLMSSYWVNFATSGDPNGKGLAKWAAWGEKTHAPMIFGSAPEGPQIPSEAGLAFFQSYFDKLIAK